MPKAEHPPGTTEVDRASEPFRWVCPNGHTDWDRTNNHAWCRACRRQNDAGEDVTPEHWEIHDKKTGEIIPWRQVELTE